MVDAKLYAIGGHVAQNAKPDALCFVLELKTGVWSPIASLPNRCGAIAATGLSGRVHAIGGAIGDTAAEKKSVTCTMHTTQRVIAGKSLRRCPLVAITREP